MAVIDLRVLTVLAVVLGLAHSETTIDSNTEIAISPSDQETNEGDVVFYRITVNPSSSNAYQVVRRYNDFWLLYIEMQKQLPDQTLFSEAPFPPKTGILYGAVDKEARRAGLEAWLTAALSSLAENLNPQMDLYNFLDPVSGDASVVSGIMIPADSYRNCVNTHFYGIRVKRHGGKGYKIYRRYSQFDGLKKTLGRAAENLAGNTRFPEKGWFGMGPFSQFDQDERRRALERWLQEVMKSPNSNNQWKGYLDEFLDPEHAKRGYLECIATAAGTSVEALMHFDQTSCSKQEGASRD